MPKGGKKPPTAEEIAAMLGVAPEKTFKVDHEGMGKVSAAPLSLVDETRQPNQSVRA